MKRVTAFDTRTFSGITAEKLFDKVRESPGDFEGDFDFVVVLVGANNLGQHSYKMNSAVSAISDTMGILSQLNPRASAFACEVCADIHYAT